MQGINKAKHVHLINALLHLQQTIERFPNAEYTQQAATYSVELEKRFKDYENLLHELSKQIAAYEALFIEVKIQFLGRKLKKMRRQTLIKKPTFAVLMENAHLTYDS